MTNFKYISFSEGFEKLEADYIRRCDCGGNPILEFSKLDGILIECDKCLSKCTQSPYSYGYVDSIVFFQLIRDWNDRFKHNEIIEGYSITAERAYDKYMEILEYHNKSQEFERSEKERKENEAKLAKEQKKLIRESVTSDHQSENKASFIISIVFIVFAVLLFINELLGISE